jgi:hypothetical protein
MSRTADDDEWFIRLLKASEGLRKRREGFRKRREWLERGFPDSSYDPDQGWPLDQFVAHVAPDLLSEYIARKKDSDLPLTDQKYNLRDTIAWGRHFAAKVTELLLDSQRFRTTGYRPGAYEPEEISPILIRDMVPDCITSDLTDTNAEQRRRFEKVRVFLRLNPKKASGGRKATYDWPTLKSEMERDPPIISRAQLIGYCRTNVKVISGKKGSPDGPDDKTVRDAISKYGLGKLIKDPTGN